MVVIAALALIAQVTPPRQTIVRDSTRPDSTARASRRPGHPAPVRRPVTEALRASAYKDAESRDLIAKARATRVSQDAVITGYDARVAQRISVKAAVGPVALERIAFRQESAARVQWERGLGARVDVTGMRISVPMLGLPKVERNAVENMATASAITPLPYFPGQEPLWVGQFAARPDVNENSLVNPLANGAEAYYTFSAGDVTTIRLPGGDTLVVRQVDVRPRQAEPNVIVGSLWLDAESGQVVRAAYRMAAPGRGSVAVSNPDSATGKEQAGARVASAILKAVVPAMVAEITDIVVEYQRVRDFWLPRSQVMEGFVKSSFAKVPVTIENAFHFESVNETSGLAPFVVDTMSGAMHRRPDGVLVRAFDQCKASPTRVVTGYMADSIPVRTEVTCNTDSLVHSPDLPASAFDAGEEIFGTAQRDALVAQALSLADQAPFGWNPFRMPDLEYGVSFTRYNRIEGWSTGLLATQQMGAGLSISALGRVGTADHRLRGEVALARSNASHALRLAAYDRLVPMSDWETPLGFGSSLSAFFFGRDDAFYYRATGGELGWTTDRGLKLDWRAFHEREHTAFQQTDYSLGGTLGPNLAADEGWYDGLGIHFRGSHGLDPHGFRLSADVRVDGATGDSTFSRASMELTFLRGFAARLDGALTLSGGSSVGGVPVQRRWYLGGTQTVRGQDPSPALSGNAYWLARAELGRPLGVARLAAFGDVGWAGDRGALAEVGRPASGAGLGLSFFDGTIRFDVARGIYPVSQTRLALYLGSRF
jgi:hypothetical protein